MRAQVGTWTAVLALATFVTPSIACSLLVGNEDRTFLAPDATDSLDATGSDVALSSEGAIATTNDAATARIDGAPVPSIDAAAPMDASPPPPVDASPPLIDSSPPPPTCPPPGAPPGTACCGSVACIGQACQHCTDCRTAGCATQEYCCAQLNGGGHYKGVGCSATPSCP